MVAGAALEAASTGGMTPLHLAALERSGPVTALVAAGANLAAGRTPEDAWEGERFVFHAAVRSGLALLQARLQQYDDAAVAFFVLQASGRPMGSAAPPNVVVTPLAALR